MWRNNQIQLLCVFSMLLMVIGFVAAQPRKPRLIPNGTWGGNHIRVDVAGGSATIDYDCANGTIQGPLSVNSAGKFDLRGIHNQERGGPIRADEEPNSQPARYKGWTDGKTMTLTVILENTNEEVGTFKLVRGHFGRVVKCK
jgi:hypothetical protein